MTNQPAEGTFSRLMATTAPIRGKQQEEQEKAPHPPVATVISPVLETPQPQKGKSQRTRGKKPTNQQSSKSSNALQQNKFDQNGTPLPSPHSDAQKRPVKPRHGFDIYWDQYEALVKWSNEEKLQGGTGSMSRMVREALDDYIAKRKNQ
jgi:hypothetical protein